MTALKTGSGSAIAGFWRHAREVGSGRFQWRMMFGERPWRHISLTRRGGVDHIGTVSARESG